MAGNKETPRQRMIGMMYLVLTALLALNVSKEIINAFVKLDRKLLDTQQAILAKSESVMLTLEAQRIEKSQRATVQPYYEQALKIREEARKMEAYIVACKNDLIKAVEGEDWTQPIKGNNQRKTFRSLMDIETKDDYDAATRLFGGDEGTDGNKKGAELRKKIHDFRNWLCRFVAATNKNGKFYSFSGKISEPRFSEETTTEYKKFISQLDKSLHSVFTEERSRVKEIYLTLTLPEKIKDFEETVDWQLGMFDHAPVVAAAALFTSLQNDILSAEAMALDVIGERVKVPPFKFNKIEPMAFAPTAYLNMGDSMSVQVMTAAYDSTEISQVKWSEESYEKAENGIPVGNKLRVNATTPGVHTMFGKISVKQNGSVVWKPWSFKYEVGQPSAFASPLDMNVLYAGADNRIGALASGYPTERVSLSAPGCALTPKGNGEYNVVPSSTQIGQRIKLTVSGRDENGNSRTLGQTEYRIRPIPSPNVYYGSVSLSKGKITKQQLLGSTSVTAGYDASIPITNILFTVKSGTITFEINGNKQPKRIINGVLEPSAASIVRSLRAGASIMFTDLKVYTDKGAQVNVGAFTLIVQ